MPSRILFPLESTPLSPVLSRINGSLSGDFPILPTQSTECVIEQSSVSYESIKLGIDAHAKHYWTSCKLVKNRRAAECYLMPFFGLNSVSLLPLAFDARRGYFQLSLKKPASGISPGARMPGGVRRSTTAQSGSFGVWSALVVSLPCRKVKLLFSTM
jgi:hypothetical protein